MQLAIKWLLEEWGTIYIYVIISYTLMFVRRANPSSFTELSAAIVTNACVV